MAKGNRGGRRASGSTQSRPTRKQLDNETMYSNYRDKIGKDMAINREFVKAAQVNSIAEDTGVDQATAEQYYNLIEDYTVDGYIGYTNGKRQSEQKQLDSIISKMPAYDGEIYRGMGFDTQQQADAFINEFTKNHTVNMKHVSSWSSSEGVAKSFSRQLGNIGVVIKVKNKSGVGIRHLSRFQREEEVLVSSNTKYKFKSMSVESNPIRKTYYIELDEI